MRSLARIDTIIFQPAFHYNTCIADMRPFHRNAQPRVTTSPTTRTNQNIILFFSCELAVHLLDIIGYRLVVGGTESTGLYIYNILHIRHNAMSQNACRCKYCILLFHKRQVFFHYLLVIHDRANLQQIECSETGILRIYIYRKLNLDRPPHLILSDMQYLIERIGQRKNLMLKNIHKRQYLTPARIVTVTNNLIIRIVCRNNKLQRTVRIRVFQI